MMESRMFHKRFSSMFSVGRNLGQNIPNIVFTVVEWDFQLYDELTEMPIIAPWQFAPRQTGYYHLNARVRINDLNVGDIFGVSYFLNAVADMANAYHQASNLNEDITIELAIIHFLTPADVVDVRVWHDFGAPRAISGDQNATTFFGYRIR